MYEPKETYTSTDVQRLLHERGTLEEELDVVLGILHLPTAMDKAFINLLRDGYPVSSAVHLASQEVDVKWHGNSQRYSDGVIRKLVALMNGVEDGTDSTQLSRPIRGEDDGGEDAT